MTEKLHIIDSLGEQGILLPARVNAALAANDRTKYYFSLLQAAAAHAEHPDRPAADLRRERLSSGVADDTWDTVVVNSVKAEDGRYKIPAAQRIVAAILQDVGVMLQPLTDRDGSDLGPRF